MGSYLRHFKTITKHKLVVGYYCFKMGLYRQGILHDLSKYSLKEFFTSGKYFQGTSSPINAEKTKLGYSYAWQHHHNKNPHHWEYWTDWREGQVYGVKIPFNYVLEMFADYIGAGKIYGGKDWNQHTPLQYHLRTREKRVYHIESDNLLTFLFNLVDMYGLRDAVRMICRNKKLYEKHYRNGEFKE